MSTDPSATHRNHVHLVPSLLLKRVPRENLHPTVLAEAERRAGSLQLRVADAITAFAGSMNFVYLHILLFAVWMLVFEGSPWPTLTLIVSLEAIFLSTFVMIGQNRQAAFQQSKADRDFNNSEKLLEENTDLTRVISELTKQIHAMVTAEVAAQTGSAAVGVAGAEVAGAEVAGAELAAVPHQTEVPQVPAAD